jgi:hypothetical protein
VWLLEILGLGSTVFLPGPLEYGGVLLVAGDLYGIVEG